MWEATRAHAGLLRSWPTAPGRPEVCPALSITSYKDKQCPLSQKSWPIGQGRHILHTAAGSLQGAGDPQS